MPYGNLVGFAEGFEAVEPFLDDVEAAGVAESDGVVRSLEVTPAYASMPTGEVTSPCVAVALARSA